MLLIANLLILLALTIIVVQDFRYRQISWFLIPVTLGGFVYKAFLAGDFTWKYFTWNVAFVLLQLLALSVYFSLRKRKSVNIINSYLGLGDILFFVVMCAVFSPVNFILFYILSLIITVVGVLIHALITRQQIPSIPLAGALAAMLIILMLANMVFPQVNFYNDQCVLTLLEK